ncbi:hypothetical protein Tco_0480894 [Tanacetum coccineum]
MVVACNNKRGLLQKKGKLKCISFTMKELIDAEEEPEEHELLNGSVVMFGTCMKKLLNKDKITKEALEGPAFELLQKRFKNSVDLEYNLEHCHLALTDKIDWANPEGHRFHGDLSKPLPLVGPPGRKTIPIRYFFNRDLEYLKYGNVEKKYDLSDEHRQWFKGNIGHKSRHEVYSKLNIISVQSIKVNKKYGYAYLEEIVVKRIGEKEYMFVEADFPHLNQNDIEDLFLLKIHNIIGVNEFDLINALQLYIRRIFMEGCLHQKVLYTIMSHPISVVYEGNDNRKWLMRADEIHTFSDGTKKGLRSSWKDCKDAQGKEEILEGSSSLLVEEETRPTTDWTSLDLPWSDLELHLSDSRIEWWKAMEGARVMTRGFGDLVAKLGDKVVMEVLVRCWSDGDVVVRPW